jgi:two-component system, cell cycle sensor histidine kinase and response regulator CckA
VFSAKHRLLVRQLKRHFGEQPPGDPTGVAFLRAVDDAYVQADEDRELLERSLSAVSEELLERFHHIQQSEAKYRHLFDGNPMPLWVYDTESLRFLAVNEAAVRQYGYSREEFLAMTILDIRPPVDAVAIRDVAGKRIGFNGARVHRHRTRDGSVLEVEITSHDLLFEGRQARIVLAMDMTQRRQVERERERALSLLRATLEATADGILVVNTQGQIESWNQRCAEMWSVPDELVQARNGAAIVDFVASQVLEPVAFTERVYEIVSLPEEESFDVIELKDGRVFERYSMPQRVGDRVVGRVWSFRDSTERLQAEAQVRRIQKLDAMGQLAGGVAHDFNNLLTAIMSNAEFALAELPAGSEARVELETIKEVSIKAAGLTRQLLAFSRKQVLVVREVKLNAVVVEAERMLRRLLPESIAMHTALAQDVELVRVDSGHLEQILVNLVVNARDAMPNGGALRICTSVATANVIDTPATLPSGEYACLVVSDTGCGMTPEVQARIFEPFFTTKEVGKGTGLGLATVFGIVQQCGGYIDVDSKLGVGTVFTIYLPHLTEETAAPVAAATLEHEERTANGEKILVVEDEDGVRTAVTRMLTRQGYNVVSARDGAEALDLYADHADVALLMTDMVMPRLGGRELVSHLRLEHQSLPVLYTSGYAHESVSAEELRTPHTAFIEKPFKLAELLASVEKLLRG